MQCVTTRLLRDRVIAGTAPVERPSRSNRSASMLALFSSPNIARDFTRKQFFIIKYTTRSDNDECGTIRRHWRHGCGGNELLGHAVLLCLDRHTVAIVSNCRGSHRYKACNVNLIIHATDYGDNGRCELL